MVKNDALISAAALRDYRVGTAMLREAIEARLAEALPANTTDIAIFGVDAVTSVVVDAARRRQLHVCAIYVADESLVGDTFAGVPVFNIQHLSPGAMLTMVVPSGSPTALMTVSQKIPRDRIVELVQRADLGEEPAEPVMISQLGEARALRSAGRLDQAFQAYQLQSLWADSVDTLRQMADLAYETGRSETAIRLYRRVLRRYPADASTLTYRVALLHKRLGRQDRAAAWFHRVLAMAGVAATQRAGCHFHLGEMCLRGQDMQGAAEHLREALRELPDHGKAQELLQRIAA